MTPPSGAREENSPVSQPSNASNGQAPSAPQPSKPKWRWIIGAVAALAGVGLTLVFTGVWAPKQDNPASIGTPSSSGTTSRSVATPTPTPTVPKSPYYQQLSPPADSPLQKVAPLNITVAATKTGTSFKPGDTGLSLEATDLADQEFNANNSTLLNMLSVMDKPFLRFGGNSVDRRFFWTSKKESMPAGYKGIDGHPAQVVTPDDLKRVMGVLDKVDGTILITVDLGHFNPDRAADFVKNASGIFGKRLVGFTVGNEPNGFAKTDLRPASYNVDAFLTEFKAYADAIAAVAPQVPVVGPGTYTESWWEPFLQTPTKQSKVLSFHHYPLYSCDGSVASNKPTIANLMSTALDTDIANYHAEAIRLAKRYNVPVWLSETGVSACPGSNPTTKVHASALWATEYLLSSTRRGAERLALHSSLSTCIGGPPMSPICSGGKYLKPDGVFSPRANYFGMLMVANIGSGAYLNQTVTGGGLTTAFSLQMPNGSTTVVLVNENDPTKSAQVAVSLKLPAKAVNGTMTQMTGPSYSAEDKTRIDGGTGAPVPLAERQLVPGFKKAQNVQSFNITAGTVTVLNYSYK
ncbi:cellulase family glycosylhydrolase [Pseudarthrobacter sp. J1738]|uniref:cellulase family glycosylhydrolase n=1 Tax=Pseudarthrobacter sp. J1738 TaxID=3420446 RepID=UPI003D2AF4F1